jgi:hypothetical protein
VGELTVKAWNRYGKDRFYLADARTQEQVGYYDRQTGELHVPDPGLRYAALAALAPFLSGEISALAHAVEAAPPPPGRDLTANSAGAAAAERAAELSPGRFQRLAAKVLGTRTEATSWEVGAAGERLVGDRLDALKPQGWNILHSVTLKSGADVDHIVIGPGGVFTVNTKHHPRARITVKGDFVRVNGHLHPYVRNSRHEAASAAKRLSAGCGWPVHVRGLLAFVGVDLLDVKEPPPDVLITPGRRIEHLFLPMPHVITPDVQARIFAIARYEGFWQT